MLTYSAQLMAEFIKISSAKISKKANLMLVLLLVLCVNTIANSTETEVIVLDSKDPNAKYSQATEIGKIYFITVEGTYHQWSKIQNPCFGVDAVWYNDIPQFDNPMLDNAIRKLLENPVWLGDSTNLTIPSYSQNHEGFRFGLRQYTGFRFNDKPLNKYPVDNLLHRYQFEAIGTGEPFKFNILDSVFSLQTEQVIPRYEDNNGFLTVSIEKQNDTTINICSVDVIYSENGQSQIKVRASILAKDSSSTSGQKNLLFDVSQIGIILQERFICPDSLVCMETSDYPLAVGLVIDKSASMSEPISQEELFYSRMESAKSAVESFIDKLSDDVNKKDSAFIFSFSNRPELVCDWSSSKQELKSSLTNIQPDSATALYSSIIAGLTKLNNNSSPRKALIVLTDGDNTRGPVWSEQCLELIKSNYSSIPIFIIGLSFSNSEREKLAIDTLNMIVKASVKGAVFKINERDSLNSIYQNIGKYLLSDDCCSLYFKGTICNDGKHETIVKLVFAINNEVIVKSISINCPEDTTFSSIYFNNKKPNIPNAIDIYPNPMANYANIKFDVNEQGSFEILIFSSIGEKIAQFERYFEPGTNTLVIDTKTYPTGIYHIVIRSKEFFLNNNFIVVH